MHELHIIAPASSKWITLEIITKIVVQIVHQRGTLVCADVSTPVRKLIRKAVVFEKNELVPYWQNSPVISHYLESTQWIRDQLGRIRVLNAANPAPDRYSLDLKKYPEFVIHHFSANSTEENFMEDLINAGLNPQKLVMMWHPAFPIDLIAARDNVLFSNSFHRLQMRAFVHLKDLDTTCNATKLSRVLVHGFLQTDVSVMRRTLNFLEDKQHNFRPWCKKMLTVYIAVRVSVFKRYAMIGEMTDSKGAKHLIASAWANAEKMVVDMFGLADIRDRKKKMDNWRFWKAFRTLVDDILDEILAESAFKKLSGDPTDIALIEACLAFEGIRVYLDSSYSLHVFVFPAGKRDFSEKNVAKICKQLECQNMYSNIQWL